MRRGDRERKEGKPVAISSLCPANCESGVKGSLRNRVFIELNKIYRDCCLWKELWIRAGGILNYLFKAKGLEVFSATRYFQPETFSVETFKKNFKSKPSFHARFEQNAKHFSVFVLE